MLHGTVQSYKIRIQKHFLKLNWCTNALQVYFKGKDVSPVGASLLQSVNILVSVAPGGVFWIRKSIVIWMRYLQIFLQVGRMVTVLGEVGDWGVVKQRELWLTTFGYGDLSLQWWANAQLQRLHRDEWKRALWCGAALPLCGRGGEERPLDPDARVPGRTPGKKRSTCPGSLFQNFFHSQGFW